MSKEIPRHYNIIPLKVIDHNPYNVCISVSLFKMRYAYKNFGKYVNNLFRWINKINPTYFVRLYTDKVTYEDEEFKRILKSKIPHLEIYIYDYPEFQDDLGYHVGTFGSVIRFVSFFDEKLREEMEYVWVADVDTFPKHFEKHIEDMKKKKVDVNYFSKACHYKPWNPISVDYPIINLRVIISKNVKVSKKKFDNFLTNVLNGRYQSIEKEIREYNKSSKKHQINPEDSIFIYGFDEIYANHILIKELSNYKRLIDYNIELKPLSYFIETPPTKELEDLRYEIFSSYKDSNKKSILKLKKLNDEIYYFLKNKDKNSLIPLMNQCYKNYPKYRNKLDMESLEFTTQIII
jgi:hypothetical protein